MHSTIYYLNIKLSGTLTLHFFLEGGQEGYPYRPKSSSLGRLKGNIFSEIQSSLFVCGHQCDQSELFGDKFSYKSSPNILQLFEKLRKYYFG